MFSMISSICSIVGLITAVIYGAEMFGFTRYYIGIAHDLSWLYYKLGPGIFLLSFISCIVFCFFSFSKNETSKNTALILTTLCSISFLVENLVGNFFVFRSFAIQIY